MRFRKKWLDIPRLSQKNKKNDSSVDWCGRTSGSMVYNYYKLIAGEPDALIKNVANPNHPEEHFAGSTVHNLLYPTAPGEPAQIAARNANGSYNPREPMDRIDGAASWDWTELYPLAGREPDAELTSEKISEILEPIFTSIDNNNPLVFYSSISMSVDNGRHIIVISGYELDENGEIWLHIDDTVTMFEIGGNNNDKIDYVGSDNLRFVAGGTDALEVDRGSAGATGARYWVRARRLFDKNHRSADPNDLWCDHSGRKGFAVLHNKNRSTPNARAYETTAFVFPVGQRTSCIPSNVIRLHRTVEQNSTGGFFPIGANSIWHGGVHLPCEGGGEVRSCADGVLVAARLGEDEEQAIGHYGSINFVLVRHEVTGNFLNQVENRQKLTGLKVLQNRNLRDKASMQGERVAKLEKGDELSLVSTEEVDDGQYRWAHVKVDKSEAPDRVGKEGFVAQGSEFFAPLNEIEEVFAKDEKYAWYSLYMHLNNESLSATHARLQKIKWLLRSVTRVKAKVLNLRQTPQTTDTSNIIGELVAGDRLERLPSAEGDAVPTGWARVRVLTSAKAALVGKEGFVATKHIKDAQEPDPELMDALRGGQVVRLDKKVNASDLLWWAGTAGSDRCGQSTTIHWEIFSADLLLPSWRTVEDPDENLTIDSQSILSLVEQSGWGDNDVLTAEEIAHFYAHDMDAPGLRTCAYRFRSEWGIDLDKALSPLSTRWWSVGLKERLEPYQWWQEARAVEVPLPSSPLVWHYNPISLLAAFSRLGGDSCPGEVFDFWDTVHRPIDTLDPFLTAPPVAQGAVAPSTPEGAATPNPMGTNH